MKNLFTCIAFLVSVLMLNAQDLTMPLWAAGKVPNYRKTDETEKKDVREIVRYSLVQNPDIAVFLPAKKTATGQAVIICPGGGYSYLSYNWEGTDPARWLASKGIAAIVLKYRLPNAKSNIISNLSPLLDAKRAIRMVRANAVQWNIDKNKVGIMGFSAGGHVASTLSTHFDDGDAQSTDSIERQSSRPDFSILVYPVISMRKGITHNGSRNNLLGPNPDTSLVNLYSNELQVKKNTPPAFLVQASDDKSVPVENSLMYYQALVANDISAEMHLFPKGGHGFGLGLGKGTTENWTNLCIDWLRSLDKVK
jgi:acetyl esterase/lipase